ncbi:hypothetical protein SESBI_41812 [Sesbania bispinosa]|nr:hypothetical protein SESBI_41812 [Sesbania bispinosa]
MKLLSLAVEDGTKTFMRYDSKVKMVERQSGQVWFDRSQVSKHSTWKTWQHRRRRRGRRLHCSNFNKQIVQSTKEERYCVTKEKPNSGRESRMEDVVISDDIRWSEEEIAERDDEGNLTTERAWCGGNGLHHRQHGCGNGRGKEKRKTKGLIARKRCRKIGRRKRE